MTRGKLNHSMPNCCKYITNERFQRNAIICLEKRSRLQGMFSFEVGEDKSAGKKENEKVELRTEERESDGMILVWSNTTGNSEILERTKKKFNLEKDAEFEEEREIKTFENISEEMMVQTDVLKNCLKLLPKKRTIYNGNFFKSNTTPKGEKHPFLRFKKLYF